ILITFAVIGKTIFRVGGRKPTTDISPSNRSLYPIIPIFFPGTDKHRKRTFSGWDDEIYMKLCLVLRPKFQQNGSGSQLACSAFFPDFNPEIFRWWWHRTCYPVLGLFL